MLNIKCQEKHLELTLNFDPQLPQYVYGDEAKIRQILINLLGNAIKFTDQGRVALNTDVVELNDEQVTLAFAVNDTGVGIAQDKIDSVFDAFTQVNNQKHLGGTGLGLPIARRLTQLMGGSLQLESTVGVGSTFTATVILKLAEMEMVKDTVAHDPKGKVVKVMGEPTLLVVDDDKTNRDLLDNTLAPLGFKVIQAVSGAQSIEYFELHRPKIVLMDYIMPQMNGVEAAQAIRQLPHGKEAVIISLTASAIGKDLDYIKAHGVDELMLKPINIDRLLDILVQLAGLEVVYQSSSSQIEEAGQLELNIEGMPQALNDKIVTALRIGKMSDLRALQLEVSNWDKTLGHWYEQQLSQFKMNELKAVFINK